jgi:hypothetical protein
MTSHPFFAFLTRSWFKERLHKSLQALKQFLKIDSNTLNLTIALPRLINIATFNKSSSKADLNLNRIVSLMQELQNSMLRGNVTPSKSVARLYYKSCNFVLQFIALSNNFTKQVDQLL